MAQTQQINKEGLGCGSTEEHLTNMYKIVSLVPSTKKEKLMNQTEY